MKNNKAVAVVHLSDMKPNLIVHLNNGSNSKFCDYGKTGKGKTFDLIKLMEAICVENKKI